MLVNISLAAVAQRPAINALIVLYYLNFVVALPLTLVHDIFTVFCVNCYVTWVNSTPNIIINKMCSQQIFYRSWYPRRLFLDFQDVSANTRPTTRTCRIFRCRNISNMCTYSAYSIVVVGIQTTALLVTLWILYGHPVYIKHASWPFEFHLAITLAVIWISRTVAGSKNWMLSKESLRVSSHSILITLVKSNN